MCMGGSKYLKDRGQREKVKKIEERKRERKGG